MKRKPANQGKVAMKCFTVKADGKSYGPFLDKFRNKVLYLEHKVGVDIDTLWIKEGWIPFRKETPPPPEEGQDNSLAGRTGLHSCSETVKKPGGVVMKCPNCGSENINNMSFDFMVFCKDCGHEWGGVEHE